MPGTCARYLLDIVDSSRGDALMTCMVYDPVLDIALASLYCRVYPNTMQAS